DQFAGVTVVSVDRIVLGVIAIHPALGLLSDAKREAFFDQAPAHPNFAYMRSRITSLLQTTPEAIMDAGVALDVYVAIPTLVNDVLATLPAALALATPACGTPSATSVFAFQPGPAGQVRLVNPKH